MPAFKEKGYVLNAPAPVATGAGDFSQWNEFEQVPELQWPASVRIFSRMQSEDSRVSSLLSAIGLPIRQARFAIAPGYARDEVTEFVARNVGLPIFGTDETAAPGRRKGRFSFAQHLVWALSSLPYGHAAFEQIYRQGEDGRVWLRKLAPRPQRTISGWNVALDGGLDSIEQMAPASTGRVIYGPAPTTIPINRLVIYSREMDPGMWIGKSVLRPSYKHWLLKDELMRIEAVAARRNGVGVPVGTAAEGASQDDVDKLAAMASAYRVGEHSGAGLPHGAKLELLGVQGNLPDIRAAIAYHDQMIAISGLAHFLNLSGGGSYALASVQENTFNDSVQTEAEALAAVFNDHVIEDLVDINFGVDEPAPRLVFDRIGSNQDATAAALKMLVEAGLLSPDVLVEQAIRSRIGLPPKPADQPAARPTAGADIVAPAAARRRAPVPAGQGALW
ncbi:phage portal protein family protein [Nocardia sp. NPDC003999]